MTWIFLIFAFLIIIVLVGNLNRSSSSTRNTDADADLFTDECIQMQTIIEDAVALHRNVLLRKRKQLTAMDDYGFVDMKEWENEKMRFISKLCPSDQFSSIWKTLELDKEIAKGLSGMRVTQDWANKFFKGDMVEATRAVNRDQEEYNRVSKIKIPNIFLGKV